MKKIGILFVTLLIIISTFANAKTLFVGDSLTQGIGDNYKIKHIDTDLNYVIGSGIENKKIDWIKRINDIDINEYDNIIISIGTNDWGLYNEKDYSQKIENFIKIINKKKNNIKIIWILPPTIKNRKINNGVLKVKRVITNKLSEHNIIFIDPNNIWGEKYRESIQNKKIRTNDGIHYTNYGAELIANEINISS